MKKGVILKERDIKETLSRIAREIVDNNPTMENVALVGIRTGGAFLATRLQGVIGRLNCPEPPAGILDITLYRDDLTQRTGSHAVGKTDLPFSIDNKTIILVDDVLFTGRTVRAALDALIDFGRPKKIELAILVDRGGPLRELPIKADYVGGTWETAPQETVNVYLKEAGHEDMVTIEKLEAA